MFLWWLTTCSAWAEPIGSVHDALEAGRRAAQKHQDEAAAEAELARGVPEGRFRSNLRLELASGTVLDAPSCEASWEVDCGIDCEGCEPACNARTWISCRWDIFETGIELDGTAAECDGHWVTLVSDAGAIEASAIPRCSRRRWKVGERPPPEPGRIPIQPVALENPYKAPSDEAAGSLSSAWAGFSPTVSVGESPAIGLGSSAPSAVEQDGGEANFSLPRSRVVAGDPPEALAKALRAIRCEVDAVVTVTLTWGPDDPSALAISGAAPPVEKCLRGALEDPRWTGAVVLELR